MLIIPPVRYSKRRRTRPAAAGRSAGPELVSAYYFGDDVPYVVLGFDRAVEASDAFAAAVGLRDGDLNGTTYQGNHVTQLSATTVSVGLTDVGADPDAGTWLNVLANNGIVAVDGGAWTGVTGLQVPFP